MKLINVVSVSGGKDSSACALIARERFPKAQIRYVFADTGNEHELTLDHVHNYMPDFFGIPVDVVRADFSRQIAGKAEYVRTKWPEKGVSQDKIDRALAVLKPTGNPFLDLCTWKGRFPSPMAQFCTHELKIIPIAEYQFNLIEAGHRVESWQGIRRDESHNRRNALSREDIGGGLSVYRPIVDWSAQLTVDYVRHHGMKLNPLYSRGMDRVGCMPCINAKKNEILEISKRFPEHVDRIAEWEKIVQEASKRDGATFFAAANQNGDLTVAECVDIGNIRAVVEWSKTSRGGKHYDIFRSDDESPGCVSSYGLCE